MLCMKTYRVTLFLFYDMETPWSGHVFSNLEKTNIIHSVGFPDDQTLEAVVACMKKELQIMFIMHDLYFGEVVVEEVSDEV